MLTQREDVQVHALQQRRWSISTIARHLNRGLKTVRAYLNGTRAPGVRARSVPDPLAPFTPYLTALFLEDPHVWASSSRRSSHATVRRLSTSAVRAPGL